MEEPSDKPDAAGPEPDPDIIDHLKIRDDPGELKTLVREKNRGKSLQTGLKKPFRVLATGGRYWAVADTPATSRQHLGHQKS